MEYTRIHNATECCFGLFLDPFSAACGGPELQTVRRVSLGRRGSPSDEEEVGGDRELYGGTQTGKPKNMVGVSGYIPIIFFLYSWGSMFGGANVVPLIWGFPQIRGSFKGSYYKGLGLVLAG